MKQAFAFGDRVKLRGKFLRNTGQRTDNAGTRVYTVQACYCALCATGDFIAQEERMDRDYFSPEEVWYLNPPFQHLNAANVFKVGTLHQDNAL